MYISKCHIREENILMKTRNAVPKITISRPLLDKPVFRRAKGSLLILRANPQSGSSVSVCCHYEREN